MKVSEFRRLKVGDEVIDRNGACMIVRSISGYDTIECQDLEVDNEGNGYFTGEIRTHITRYDVNMPNKFR